MKFYSAGRRGNEMWNKRFETRMVVCVIVWCLVLGLICIPATFASQPCFKCCGSKIWHVDNKIPCSGKGCNYCVKCNGCNGSGQIPDAAKRCNKCKGLGQVHKNSKKVCTSAGCKYCSPYKVCKTKGWVQG